MEVFDGVYEMRLGGYFVTNVNGNFEIGRAHV